MNLDFWKILKISMDNLWKCDSCSRNIYVSINFQRIFLNKNIIQIPGKRQQRERAFNTNIEYEKHALVYVRWHESC